MRNMSPVVWLLWSLFNVVIAVAWVPLMGSFGYFSFSLACVFLGVAIGKMIDA